MRLPFVVGRWSLTDNRQSGPGGCVSRPASSGAVYSSNPQRWGEPTRSGVAPKGTMNVA